MKVEWFALLICATVIACSLCQVVEDCRTDTFPPAANTKLPMVVVNLDEAPATRWNNALIPVKDEINALVKTIVGYFNKYLLEIADVGFELLGETLPEPYRSEIKGVADVLGLPVGEVVIYNVFYELFTVCTSIIAEDSKGDLYHARNLDFGLFLGWDSSNDTWLITEELRKVVKNVDFQKDGKTVYQSASFLGYVGLMTAVKPGYFTLTVNERFNKDGGYKGIFQWIMGDRSARWMGFLARDVMESAESYSSARDTLQKVKLLAPAYYILSGNSTGEGVIITRGREDCPDVQEMNITSGRFYLLQTNYDPWVQPPFFDDRRGPGNICMKQWGQKTVGFKSLFNVLSTKPNLNKLTVYTSILTVRDGVSTWMQDCKTPCTPW